MKATLLEKRIARLEKFVNESVKGNAKDEVRDDLSSWLELRSDGRRRLMGLRRQIMNNIPRGPFDDLVDDLKLNDSDALAFYGNGDADNLYDSQELEIDVLDIIDELVNI